MLHMFHLDVAKVDMVLHILRWLYIYVASVCFKCFNCFKRMLQVFYLDVAYVAMTIHISYKYMFQMFQLFQKYVASVLSRCCNSSG
jgi:energy-coupling factor transporter transmembrane protein EcfT